MFHVFKANRTKPLSNPEKPGSSLVASFPKRR
jgi:hypothetical protein